MPNIVNETIISNGSTIGRPNARKITKLDNGWIVVGLFNNANRTVSLLVKKNESSQFTPLTYVSNINLSSSFAVASYGNNIILSVCANDSIICYNFDALTVTNVDNFGNFNKLIDSGLLRINNVSTSINKDKTKILVGYSYETNGGYSANIRSVLGNIDKNSKTVTYNNPINVRGSIYNTPNVTDEGCAVSFTEGNNAVIAIYNTNLNTPSRSIVSLKWDGSAWSNATAVYSENNNYNQTTPCILYVDKNIDGTANGTVELVWSGNNPTNNINQVKRSFSTNGGTTWSVVENLASSSVIKTYPTMTVNSKNEKFVLYCDYAYGNVNMITNKTGAWVDTGRITNFVNNPYTAEPSAMIDTKNYVTSPIFIALGDNRVAFYGSWDTTTISPLPSFLGYKSDNNNILSYSISNETGIGTVEEYVNGVLISTKNPNSGQLNTLSLDDLQWNGISYGLYRDSAGNKNEIEIRTTTNSFFYTFGKTLSPNAKLKDVVKADADANETYLQANKTLLTNAANGKGASIPANATFEAIANGIKTIPSNSKKASGVLLNQTFTVASQGTYYLNINTLDFKPSTVWIWVFGYTDGANSYTPTVFSNNVLVSSKINSFFPNLTPQTAYGGTVFHPNSLTYNYREANSASMYNGGFQLPIFNNDHYAEMTYGTNLYKYTVNWFAVE